MLVVRGHWSVYYSSSQSFMIIFSYSLGTYYRPFNRSLASNGNKIPINKYTSGKPFSGTMEGEGEINMFFFSSDLALDGGFT